MSESRFIIRKENLPVRCDICHQSDQFNPPTGQCSRCAEVQALADAIRVATNFPSLEARNSLWMEAMAVTPPARRRTFFAGMEYYFEAERPHQAGSQKGLIHLLIVVIVIGTIASIVIPMLLSQRREENRKQAQQILHNLYKTQKAYQRTLGEGNFSNKLMVLSEVRDRINQISDLDTGGPHDEFCYSGYIITDLKATPRTSTSEATFSAVMFPAIQTGLARTGNDCFYIDQTGVIRHSGSSVILPDATSPPIP